MKGFTANGTNASGSASKTAVNVIASTTVRPALFEIIIGNSAAGQDYGVQMAARRHTAVGTAGSSPTPQALDSSDVAAIATAGAAHSAEPTYSTGNLLEISLNARATFRWVAMPGFELKAPATANNGIGVQLVAASTATQEDVNIAWFE